MIRDTLATDLQIWDLWLRQHKSITEIQEMYPGITIARIMRALKTF